MKLFSGAVVIAILAAGSWALSPGKDPAPRSLPTLTTAVEHGDIFETVTAAGKVKPVRTVEVGTQVSGQIAALYADFDSRVTKGDLIAQIDPSGFETAVGEAEAALAVAESQLVLEQAGLKRAEAALVRAEREANRKKVLRSQGHVSDAAYDTAQLDLAVAQADVESAKAQITNAQSRVRQSKATVEQAQVNLGYTQIRAPIDGVVLERLVDSGQTVAATMQTPRLFVIAEALDSVQIDIAVDEAEIGRVAAGQPATFAVPAYPDTRFTGRVASVRTAPNAEGGLVTYTVVATAENPGLSLRPGMSALVEIAVAQRQDVLRLPAVAVQPGPVPGTATVLRFVAGGQPEPVVIKTGLRTGEFVEISPDSPLAEGDQIVLPGLPAGDPMAQMMETMMGQ